MSTKITKSEIQLLWRDQLTVLSFREPSWILKFSLAPLVVLGINALLNISSGDMFVSTLRLNSTAYILYLLFALIIYFYLKHATSNRINPYIAAWLYGIHGICSIIYIALFFFALSFSAFSNSRVREDVLLFLEFVALISFLGISLISFIFSPHRENHSSKTGIGFNNKLAIAIPTFLVGFGIVLGQFLSHTGEYRIGFMLAGGASLIISFLLNAISIVGLRRMIAMAIFGFNNVGLDTSG